ncbi:MAG TPA: ABC transporter permease [Anaeromyxobacter sp.]|nr:ABC transporter permease [Anaeromyxobacter sp.]
MAKEFTQLAHAVRNLRRRPTRTVTLVAAIGLLVSALVFALSFVRRVEAGIRTASGRLGADVIVVPTGSRGAAEDVLLDNAVKTFYMDREIADRVRATKGVARVTTQTYLATIAGNCCDVPETIVVAFDQESDFVVAPWLPRALGKRLERGEAVVGSESAFNIRIGLTQVDGRLFGKVFHVLGVLEKTGTGLDTAIFVDEKNVGELVRGGTARPPPGAISVVFVKVEPGVDPARVAGAIEDSIIEADAVARRDVGQTMLRAFGDVSRVFAVTFALAAVLAACLAWAVFTGVANERIREVGLMRAIGAKESHVVRLFLLEVVLVGALGSLAGVVAGTGLSLGLVKGFDVLRSAPAALGVADRLAIAALGLAAGTAICVVGALSPIRSTRRTEPLAVLKGD